MRAHRLHFLFLVFDLVLHVTPKCSESNVSTATCCKYKNRCANNWTMRCCRRAHVRRVKKKKHVTANYDNELQNLTPDQRTCSMLIIYLRLIDIFRNIFHVDFFYLSVRRLFHRFSLQKRRFFYCHILLHRIWQTTMC